MPPSLKYDIEASFGSIVRRADGALIQRLNQHFRRSGHDITTEQYRLLVTLWNRDGRTQQELARVTGKNKTNITRLIHGLEKRNLVVRVPDRSDQRIKRIHLTPKGRDLPGALVKLARKTLREALGGVPEADIETARKVLLAVIDNLDRYPKPGSSARSKTLEDPPDPKLGE